MSTNKTTVVAEIKIDGSGASQTVGQLKDELSGIGTATAKAAEGSIAQLKELKKQLKLTAAGSEDFKKLYNQIDDLEDKIKSSKNVSKDWIDTLEGAGGPLGMVGGAINKAKVATESFGSALKATGIGLIVALLAGLAAAFAKNEGAMKKLQPVFDAFGRILNGVLGAMQPLIDATIEFALKALPYVSKAFEVAYSSVSAFMQSLGMMGSAVKKFISGDFSGAWDDAKKSVTSFGDNYEAANKRFMDGASNLTDHEKEELKKREDARIAAAAKAKVIQDKIDADKLAAEKKANDELLKEWEDYVKRRNYAAKNAVIVSQEDLDIQAKEKKDKNKTEREKEISDNLEWQNIALSSYSDSLDKQVEIANIAKEKKLSFDEAEKESKYALVGAIGGAIGELGGLFEQGSNAAKIAGLSTIAINTAVGYMQGLDIAQKSAKATGPAAAFAFPIFYASQVAAILTAVGKAKSIMTQVKGGGSGGVNIPSSSFGVSAPLSPTASVTNFNQDQINQIGNKASRAYVVESDITGNQERIERLNRAARIG